MTLDDLLYDPVQHTWSLHVRGDRASITCETCNESFIGTTDSIVRGWNAHVVTGKTMSELRSGASRVPPVKAVK